MSVCQPSPLARASATAALAVVGLGALALPAHAADTVRLVDTTLSPSTISTRQGSQFALTTHVEAPSTTRSTITVALPAAPADGVSCEVSQRQGGGDVTRVGSSWVVTYAPGLAKGRHALGVTCTLQRDVVELVGGLLTLKDESGAGQALRWRVPGNPQASASSVATAGAGAVAPGTHTESGRDGARPAPQGPPAPTDPVNPAAPAAPDARSNVTAQDSAAAADGRAPADPQSTAQATAPGPGVGTWVALVGVALLGVIAVVGVSLRLLVRPARAPQRARR